MHHPDGNTRRTFLGAVAAASAASAVASTALADDVHELKPTVEPPRPGGPNDRIRIATIGMGIIGFIDTETALKVPVVELVAASDLYEGRRTHAQEVFGARVDTLLAFLSGTCTSCAGYWRAFAGTTALGRGKWPTCSRYWQAPLPP